MSKVQSVTFKEALFDTRNHNRHLLLGNGFSIAASHKFEYKSLVEAAGELDPNLLALFREHGTPDFEVVLEELMRARAQAAYDCDLDAEQEASKQIASLKEHLLRAVYNVHPQYRSDIASERFESCCQFLEHFIGNKLAKPGIAFSTNYDLLLYWAAAKYMKVGSRGRLRLNDAFWGGPWDSDQMRNVGLSLVYLHGALHIFNSEGDVIKVRYQDGYKPLTLRDQIKARLDIGEFPVFVSEGTSDEKKARIKGNPYLAGAYEKFYRACRDTKCVLFTFGHSLADRDRHIADLIGKGKISRVYLGAYGPPDAPDNAIWAQRLADVWTEQRGGSAAKHPIEVFAYDTRDRRLWCAA